MKIKKIIVSMFAAGVMVTPLAHATNGYFSHGYGMKAKGMGGTATATDSDAMGGANNPASMVWVGDRLDVGVDWFSPIRSASRSGASSAMPLVPPLVQPFFAGSSLNGSEDSGSDNFLVPEFGYNKMLSNSMSLGITVYGNGGMNTNYSSGAAIRAGNCPTQTGPSATANNLLCGNGELGVNLEQLIIAPTVAYKFNETNSVGVSPLFGYQHFRANGLQAFSQISSAPANLTNLGHDNATGWGLRVGWMGKMMSNVTLGAAYSTKIKMGKFDSYRGLFAEQGGFDIPENFNLGIAVKATDAWTIAADYQRINYGDVKSVGNPSTQTGCTPTPPGGPGVGAGCLGGNNGIGFGWASINVYKIGAEYKYSPALTLRAGYNHGDNPIQSRDVTFNILAPGVIQDHLTMGMTYGLSKNSEVTASYMHAFANSVSGAPNTVYFPAGGTDTIRMYQNSLGIAYGMKY